MPGENLLSTGPIQVSAISPGIAIGPAHVYRPTVRSVTVDKIDHGSVKAEMELLHKALAASIDELGRLSEHLAQTVGRSEADIFAAQQLMLEDPDLLAEVEKLITQQHLSSISALSQAAENQARELEALENETLAARAADVRDVAARVIGHLQKRDTVSIHGEDSASPTILVAYDLTPSDTATLDPRTILGICTVVGGPTTHAAIIARALEIPAIAGCDPAVLDLLHAGQQIAIDGTQGLLYLHLADDQQSELRASMLRQREARGITRMQNEARWRHQAGCTADGVAVQMFANVGDVESARAAAGHGAEGIGLLRTEFLFGSRAVFPDEEEQFESYTALFRAFADHASLGKTIIARTLDAGADKPFPALEPLVGALQEANPALGLRGARIHLLHEELLRQQLRALMRAGVETGVMLHIMFPMIATLEEVRHLRRVYNTVRQELQDEGVAVLPHMQVGIMIETPAAALMTDVLVREVDFFSIGANDLFQYTMAADRTNNRVTGMFGLLEPAVWRLIDNVVCAGMAYGKPVAVCGELAADVRIGPLLAGLGVQELSMSPPAIPRVKAALHERTMEFWRNLAHTLLKAETAAEIQDMLQSL